MTTIDPTIAFADKVRSHVDAQQRDADLRQTSSHWLRRTHDLGYDYNFRWMGRPILQLPQDVMALQEICFAAQPDVIIETGVAHGGSLVFFASMLHLLGGERIAIGVDVEIREHNGRALLEHPMADRIHLLEASSTDPSTIEVLTRMLADRFCGRSPRVMVVLDSDHTHDHVLQELRLYGDLVSDGSYMVVCDTAIEVLGDDACPGRPWGPGNSPKSAVDAFLADPATPFEVDHELESKLLLTNSPGGYLRCRR